MGLDNWRDGWVIFRKDLRSDRMFILFNVLFMLYTGIMISFSFQDADEVKMVLRPIADFMMLMMIPFTGFYFSRRSFSYIKENSYTTMLVYYRSLPIPVKAIMKGRLIQFFTAFMFNGLVFFTVMYLMSQGLRGMLNLEQYIVFALTWAGFGILINGIYIYFELLNSGRMYLWVSFILTSLIVGSALIINYLDFNLNTRVIEFARQYSFLSPLMWGSLFVGVAGGAFFVKLTERRLVKRDLVK
jgi:hypothetical protein